MNTSGSEILLKPIAMENHYSTLGLNTSASSEEIRRAYRILARRYHPDLNPGQPAAEERFKKISLAYDCLSDPKKKRQYDAELEGYMNADHRYGQAAFERARRSTQRAHRRYAEAYRTEALREEHLRSGGAPGKGARESEEPSRSRHSTAQRREASQPESLWQSARRKLETWIPPLRKRDGGIQTATRATPPLRVSVIEVSVSITEAIQGARKTIELDEPEGPRKLSVTIPSGVRNGSVVRLRSKASAPEEIILIIRVAHHPFVSIQTRGLVVEVPVTVHEAIHGAHVVVPTPEEPVTVKIPPGSSSGTEIRIPERGLTYRDGARGDLFARILVMVPASPDAVGLKEKAREIDPYYESKPRDKLPKSLLS